MTDTPVIFLPATRPPTGTPILTDTPVPSDTPIPPCTPELTYLADLTIPDYSVVAPGSALDKQWSVQNSGTCNWDVRYRLRLVSGPGMGVQEQALYPARAGTQAVLQMNLTAPLEPGWYTSTWQAVAPDDTSFGNVLTITIYVQAQ